MWAVALSLLLAAEPSTPRPRVFALVIGNNHPDGEGSAELKFADDDALAMHELLLETRAQSVLLVDADADTRAMHPGVAATRPTVAAVAAAWERVRADMATVDGAPVEFVFFFSGHGDVSHGEGYLSLEDGRLTRSMVQAMLAASPARRNHVVIDACKSYFAVLGRGPGGRRAPYPGPFATDARPGPRSGFLLSTSSDGDSHEWERFQAGVFSFELRSALRGSADVNRDGVITYRELGGFLQRANEGIASPRFRPSFLVVPPGGTAAALDEPVLRWPDEPPALDLDGPEAHFYVEAPSGRRVLELNRAANVTLGVRLPPERPLYLRSADEREERVLETLTPTAWRELRPEPPGVTRKGALHVAFTRLFSAPFDPGAVQTFALDASLEARAREGERVPEGLRTGALVTAGVATAVALGAMALGFERISVTPTTSQRERFERNAALPAINTTMGVAGGVAVAALGTWLVLQLTAPGSTRPTTVTVGPSGAALHVEF